MADPIRINAESSALEEWRRVRRLSRWANNRRLRRVVLLLWVVVLGVDVWLALAAWRYPHTTMLLIVLFFLAAWAMQRMGKGLALPTLEDRAVLEYGAEFDALKEKQRGEVFDQQVRDNVLGRTSRDEREGDLRRFAEAAAYRVLCYVVGAPSLAVWVLADLPRFAAMRHELEIAAVASNCFAVVVFALPSMIRVWTEPDQLGEVQLVGRTSDGEST